MVGLSDRRWESLERWRATAFLLAGVMFVVDAAIVGAVIVAVGEDVMLLGQAFIAAGWTAAFVGLLGVYPGLSDRSPWLARAAAVFAVIGAVVFVAMAVASLVYFAGIPDGEITAIVPFFLPGVIIGSVLGFLCIGAASLRSDVHSTTVGVLLVALGLFPVVNIASGIGGVESLTFTLAIVVGLALVNLAIGYLFRTGGALAGPERTGRASDATP